VAVVATSLVRAHLGHRSWRAVHLTSYAAWGLAVTHGLGIGTDTPAPWARWCYVVSAAIVVGSTLVRLLGRRIFGREPAGVVR
jgi:sulfoxide reductase heme-binding subunit YedZ